MDALQKKSGSVPLVGVGSYISATCHFISVDWDLRDLTLSLSIQHKQKKKISQRSPLSYSSVGLREERLLYLMSFSISS